MEVRTTTDDTNSSVSEEHFRRQFLFVPGGVAEITDPAVHTYKSSIAGSKDGRKHASGTHESLFRRVG